MSRVGIFGGTFNPIHFGHLMISEYLREECDLEEVLFVPTGNPPHKNTTVNAMERYHMVKIATADNPNFKVLDVETHRRGNSYTVDTIREIKKFEPRDLYFLIGLDTLFELKTWKKIDLLAKEITFIVALRPDYINHGQIRQEKKFLRNHFGLNLEIIPTPLYEISSTELRRRLQEGKSVKYLIPDPVISYIEEKKLY
ncbi:MAG: nicotinate-nucleotide adenylyltransferase [Tissierellia bacterium]|nr:nicotinate-nucleotide adenylyltransferase [Tissierellia bacterium]